MEYELGRGILAWDRKERISDRYGAVLLTDSDSDGKLQAADAYTDEELVRQLTGKTGSLIADVLVSREPAHIGDLARGFYPIKPKRGDRVNLGQGKLFSEKISYPEFGGIAVGLEPNDGRESDWLDPQVLYRLHNQTVVLRFITD